MQINVSPGEAEDLRPAGSGDNGQEDRRLFLEAAEKPQLA